VELQSAPLIGMLHLPNVTAVSLDEIIEFSVHESGVLQDSGFDGIMIENFNDVPFAKEMIRQDRFATISVIAHEVKKQTTIPIGINLLRNACKQSLYLCVALDLDFMRCNIWESAYVTDQGIINGAAYEVSELKQSLASKSLIFADIMVKHAYPLGNFTLLDAAKNALDRGGADKIIISGSETGKPPEPSILDPLNQYNIYPIIGSGLNLENMESFHGKIGGAIIGTSIKFNKKVSNNINPNLAREIVEKWGKLFK